MGELVFLFSLVAISGYYYYESLTYTTSRFERTGGPAVFPQIVIYGLLFFILLRIIQIIFKKDRTKFNWLSVFKGTRGVFFIAFVVYVLSMQFLGFIVSGFLFLITISTYMYKHVEGTVQMFSFRKFGVRSLVMFLFVIFINYFFAVVLNVQLPKGMLSFLF